MWGDFKSGGGGPAEGGQDTFVFGPNNGEDFIYDFQQGFDIIEINSIPATQLPAQAVAHIPSQAGNFPESFEELDIDEVGGNSVITFDADNSVTVVGVTGLAEADFMFT
jgi:hypothetical protein